MVGRAGHGARWNGGRAEPAGARLPHLTGHDLRDRCRGARGAVRDRKRCLVYNETLRFFIRHADARSLATPNRLFAEQGSGSLGRDLSRERPRRGQDDGAVRCLSGRDRRARYYQARSAMWILGEGHSPARSTEQPHLCRGSQACRESITRKSAMSDAPAIRSMA